MRFVGLIWLCGGFALFASGCKQDDRASDDAATSADTSSSSDDGEASEDDSQGSGESSGGLPKLDVGSDTGDACDGVGGEIEFSNIWIANYADGTVSKIDTITVQEVGRYRVHPNSPSGSPSRTSVSLSGDMVVANRSHSADFIDGAGVTMVRARLEDCVESNGQPGIQTSTDGTALPWGEDECVIWHTPLTAESNRPVQWTSGERQEDCSWINPKVWTATSDEDVAGGVIVYLLDGATGAIEQTVEIPEYDGGDRRPYGGAVDSKNGFWVMGNGSTMFRVDFDTLDYEAVPLWGYGIIVDNKDRVWLANFGATRYDPETGETATMSCGHTCTGIVQDQDGFIWLSGDWNSEAQNAAVVKVDAESMEILHKVMVPEIPEMQTPKGMAADVEGYIWVVEGFGNKAFKLDPETYAYEYFESDVNFYTYSDMTGWGLRNVATPEG